MILFEHNKDLQFDGNQGPDRIEEEDEIKDRFLRQTALDEGLKEKVKKNIYVAYNTEMFKLDIGSRGDDQEEAKSQDNT